MTTPRIDEVLGVEVEHMVGEGLHNAGAPAGLVKMRVQTDVGVAICQMAPETARRIAVDLFEMAARAEYEGDMFMGASRLGMEALDTATMVSKVVRIGEQIRRTTWGPL